MRQEGIENYDISIFVEERVEYIHSRIPLRPLITGIEQSIKLSTIFESRANTTFGRILNGRVRRMGKRLETKLKRVYSGRVRKVVRRKRSIEIIGNLISKLFGNPGPEDWKQNTRNIIAMKEAIERQVQNSVVQHHDIDQNRHAINEQSEILRQTTRAVMSNENRLNHIDNELTEIESYFELESMIESVDEILEALIDIKRDAKTGRCNEKGLNPEFLIEHLRRIESNKNSIAPIFASWEWQKYYNFEMCSVALHGDELWVTMRIPIVNLAEQFVRTTPTSSQLWIRDTFYGLGFETLLFKMKNQDVFMMTLKNSLEVCSTLGTSRVCNMRKSKFREATPYVVPIDINHNRVLIVANSTESYSTISNCNNIPSHQNLSEIVILKIPDKCALVSKHFEVSKIATNSNFSTMENVGQIETVKIQRILRKSENKVDNLKEMNSTMDADSEDEIIANNEKTLEALSRIRTSSNWSTESLLVTTSGTSTALLIMIIGVVLALKCIKKCKSGSSEQIFVNVSSERNESTKDIASSSSSVENESEIHVCNANECAEFENEKKSGIQTPRSRCHFNK